MNEDCQETMGAMAEETIAAHSIRNERKNDVELDKEDERELGSATEKAQGVGMNRCKKKWSILGYTWLCFLTNPTHPHPSLPFSDYHCPRLSHLQTFCLK